MPMFLRILILFLTSCSAQKAEYAVINDFLEAEHKSIEYDTIYVSIEPYDVLEAIKLYEVAYEGRNDQNSSYAKVWTTPELTDWPLSGQDISRMKENLSGTDKNWTEADFRNKRFVFKTGSVLEDRKFKISHFDKGTKEYVLRLSRPVLNKDKTYALFRYYFTELLMGSSPGPNRGAVIMRNKNGKWVVVASIREAVYE